MKYTIEQLQAEYMEACDSVRIAEKAQSEANANYQFEIDKHKGDGYSRFSAWIEENREELDELQAATDTARAFVHETRLYKECILEMLQNAARETLEATLYGENFKGDNMPMHFKKWRAYALENFSEDIGASVDGRYIRLFWSRKDPVTGEYLPGSTDLGEYMAYGIKGDINAPIFCSEEYTGEPYTRQDGATFAQVRRACVKAAEAKNKYKAIMEAAKEKADKLASDTARGLHTLYFEIRG